MFQASLIQVFILIRTCKGFFKSFPHNYYLQLMPQYPEWSWWSIFLQKSICRNKRLVLMSLRGKLAESGLEFLVQNMEQKLTWFSLSWGCEHDIKLKPEIKMSLEMKAGTWALLPTLTERNQGSAGVPAGEIFQRNIPFGNEWCWELQWGSARWPWDPQENPGDLWASALFSPALLQSQISSAGSPWQTTFAS